MRIFRGLVLVLAGVTRVSAGPSVSVSVNDLSNFSGLESIDLKGDFDLQLTDNVKAKVNYSPTKDLLLPSSLSTSTSTDTSAGKLFGTVTIDPKTKAAKVVATLRNECYGSLSTDYTTRKGRGGMFGSLVWKSLAVPFPFATGNKQRPMVVTVDHNLEDRSNALKFEAQVYDGMDVKLDLPAVGEPVFTVMGERSLDEESGLKGSVSLPSLLDKGFGKGAVGVTYTRDLSAVSGSSSKLQVNARDTGDFMWSLTNTTPRTTTVISGRGEYRSPLDLKSGSVSIKQSMRLL